jgi:hypothetical protein
MAKGLFAGATDYSNQSLNDIITDLDSEYQNISAFIDMIEQDKAVLESNKYWGKIVPIQFKIMIEYALKHYKTVRDELNELKNEIGELVEEHHIKIIKNASEVASEININIGKTWHQDYRNKNYEDANFKLVEKIYEDTRDMAVNLLDLSNIAKRLENFIGKKNSHMKTLNILFFSSSPSDEKRLRVDIELRKIEETLASTKCRDKIILNKKGAVKPETMTQAMLEFKPNIVHFAGHGNNEGIVIENDNGYSVFFPLEGLERLFSISLFKETIQCVILNACYSEKQAEVISKNGIYVVGMNSSIGDEAAIKFSLGFYQAIGNGDTIEVAFSIGMVLISQYLDNINTPCLWKDGSKIK